MGFSGINISMCFDIFNFGTSLKCRCMVAYFCHHLSDNYVDLSDLYVDLSVIYVDLSDHYVDLSEKYHSN